ncbi:MAG: hypothetical protein ABWY56_15045 [Propionibacteriaceae bacterium]
MGARTGHRRLVVLIEGLILLLTASVLLGRVPAAAATTPPPASQLRLSDRSDHMLELQFAVPAAYYHPGASAVVRITRGRTPAASPTAGYPVQTNTLHQARAGSNPPLGAEVAYTFAVWIIDGGKLSPRATLTATTLKDTHPPDDIIAAHAAPGISPGPRVIVDWANPCCDELDTVQIIRNTKNTPVGGTVFNVPAAPQAWADEHLPASIDDYTRSQRFSAAPLYYFLKIKDKAGNYSRFDTRTDVVFASRTISGTVTGKDRYLRVYCCTGINGAAYVSGLEGLDGSVNGGKFTVNLPPSSYTICTGGEHQGEHDPTASCWVPGPNGTGTKRPWDGTDEGVPSPTIDLTINKSYDDVHF